MRPPQGLKGRVDQQKIRDPLRSGHVDLQQGRESPIFDTSAEQGLRPLEPCKLFSRRGGGSKSKRVAVGWNWVICGCWMALVGVKMANSRIYNILELI